MYIRGETSLKCCVGKLYNPLPSNKNSFSCCTVTSLSDTETSAGASCCCFAGLWCFFMVTNSPYLPLPPNKQVSDYCQSQTCVNFRFCSILFSLESVCCLCTVCEMHGVWNARSRSQTHPTSTPTVAVGHTLRNRIDKEQTGGEQRHARTRQGSDRRPINKAKRMQRHLRDLSINQSFLRFDWHSCLYKTYCCWETNTDTVARG